MSRTHLHRRAVVLLLLAAVLATGWGGSASIASQPERDAPLVARITTRSADERQRLSGLDIDLLEMRDGDDFFALTSQIQLERLRAEGWLISVDKEQSALLEQQALSITSFDGGYRTTAEMRAALLAAEAQYPHLADYIVYGQSWEGDDLFAAVLTSRYTPGPKPTFFLMAGIHARELATPELALRLVEHLLSGYGSDGDVTWLLDEHRIVLVPSANPDGHRRVADGGDFPFSQRKNRNTSAGLCLEPPTTYNQYGIDLNRNHSFKWGGASTSTDPCSLIYRGASPASEPETVAIQSLIASLFADQRGPQDSDAAPVDAGGILISLHSYSDLVLYPWGYTSFDAPNGPDLSLIGRRMASYNGYTFGQPGEVLYEASGTSDDWAYGQLGIASFTFEVGPASGDCAGFMPSYDCLDGSNGAARNFWSENLPAFLYAARIARTPYLLARGPAPQSLSATPVATHTLTLSATFDETANGGQTIAAAEFYLDSPPWRGGSPLPMSAADGSFNSQAEAVTAQVTAPGRRLIFARAQDSAGNWGPVRAVLVETPLEAHSWLPAVRR